MNRPCLPAWPPCRLLAPPACTPAHTLARPSPALPLPSAWQLKDYQTIVDLYKLRWIDFDIEGGAVLEMASVQRRHRVLKRLQVRWAGAGRRAGRRGRQVDRAAAAPARPTFTQRGRPGRGAAAIKHGSSRCRPSLDLPCPSFASALPPAAHAPPQDANPGLVVSFTLPVLPVGLTADGVNLLRDAKAKGVRLDVLNIMTMDYGDSAAPSERPRPQPSPGQGGRPAASHAPPATCRRRLAGQRGSLLRSTWAASRQPMAASHAVLVCACLPAIHPEPPLPSPPVSRAAALQTPEARWATMPSRPPSTPARRPRAWAMTTPRWAAPFAELS